MLFFSKASIPYLPSPHLTKKAPNLYGILEAFSELSTAVISVLMDLLTTSIRNGKQPAETCDWRRVYGFCRPFWCFLFNDEHMSI